MVRRRDAFDPSAALAVLDVFIEQRFAPGLPSVGAAWDAAWIACMTNDPTWSIVAQRHFADVSTELAAMIRPTAKG